MNLTLRKNQETNPEFQTMFSDFRYEITEEL